MAKVLIMELSEILEKLNELEKEKPFLSGFQYYSQKEWLLSLEKEALKNASFNQDFKNEQNLPIFH